jgi:purine nucleosidase
LRNHLIIDTDIGTDVDDALALTQIIGSRPFYGTSVTTVYGDVEMRAQIASNYCRLMGSKLEIYAGESKTISGKEVWTSGMEGNLHDALNVQDIQTSSGVEHIISLLKDSDLSVELLAIAPLTNLATALRNSAESLNDVKKVYLMGGRFSPGKVEHNIFSDVDAAKEVLHSALRIDVVGIEITSELQINIKEFLSLQKMGAAGLLLYKEIEQWAKYWNRDWIVPHDSIAFLMKSKPELFEFSNLGEIEVFDDGKTEFHENSRGTKRIVKNIDIEGARLSIIDAIEGVKFRS